MTKNAFHFTSAHNLKLYFKFSSNSSVYSPVSTFVSSMLHAIFAHSSRQARFAQEESVSCDTRDNDSRLPRARAPAFAPRDWSLVYLDHAIFTQIVKNISGQIIHTLRIRSIYHLFCSFRVVPLPGFTISNLVSVQENESW